MFFIIIFVVAPSFLLFFLQLLFRSSRSWSGSVLSYILRSFLSRLFSLKVWKCSKKVQEIKMQEEGKIHSRIRNHPLFHPNAFISDLLPWSSSWVCSCLSLLSLSLVDSQVKVTLDLLGDDDDAATGDRNVSASLSFTSFMSIHEKVEE